MRSGSSAAWREASPPETFGEPDDGPPECPHGVTMVTGQECADCRADFWREMHPPCSGCGLRLETAEMVTCADYPSCIPLLW